MEPQPSAPSFAAPTLSGLDEASLSAAASTQDELSPRVHIESVPPKRKHPILARLKPVLTRDTALFLACLIGFVFIATAQTTTSFVVDVWWGGHKNPREFNTRLDLSVWRTVEKLWEYDAKGLAVLLALFAGVVPYLKTAAVAVAVAPPMLRRWLPTWAPVFVFNAGKWIFFDVWVAFSVVAMMQFAVQNGLVIVNGAAWADKGVFAFFGACVYSQLLSAIHLYSPPTHATSASASSDASLRDNGLASDEKTWKTAETPASMAPPARLPGATPPHVLQHSREHVQTHVPTHGVVGMNTGLPPPSPARGAVGSVPEASGSKPWHTRGLTGVKARPLPLTPSRKEQTITQGSNFSKAHAAKNTVGQETVGEEHEEEDDGVALDTHAEAADTVVAAAADVTAQRDERKEAAHPTVDAGADDGSRAPVTEEVGDYVPASHGSNAADDATGYDGNCEYEYVPDGNTLVRTPQSLAPAISSLPPPTLALGGGRAGRRKGKGRNAVGAGGAAGNQRGSEVGMCCDEAGNSSSAVSTPSASAPNSAVPSPGHSPAPAPPRSVALAASAEAVAADIAAGTVGGLAEVHATIAASANAATLAQHEQESKRRGEDDAADNHGYQSNSNSNSSSLSSPAVEEKQPQPMHGAWVSERAHPLPEPLAPLDEAARENRAAQQKSQYQQYQPRKHKPSTPSSMFAAEAEPLACDSALAPSTVMVAASRTAFDQQQPTVTRTATRAVVTPIEVAEARAQGPLTRLPPHIALLFFSAVTAAILVSLLLPVLSQSVLLMKEPRFTATPSVAGMLSAAFSAAPAANAGLAALAAVFVVAIPLVRATAGLAAALALELLWITASKPSTKSSAMSAAEASAAGEEDDDGAAPSTGPVCRSSSEVCPRPASAAQPLGALAVARLRTRSAAAATVRLCARARALLGPWGSAEVFASALLAMASEVPRIFRNSGGGVRVGLALSAQLPLVLLLVAGAADALGGWAVLRMARTPVPVRAGLSGGVKVAGKGLWATEKEWEARTSARVAAAAAAGVGGGDGAEEEDEAEYSTRLHSESVSCSQSRSCGRTGSQETEAMTPLASTMTPIGREEMMKKGF